MIGKEPALGCQACGLPHATNWIEEAGVVIIDSDDDDSCVILDNDGLAAMPSHDPPEKTQLIASEPACASGVDQREGRAGQGQGRQRGAMEVPPSGKRGTNEVPALSLLLAFTASVDHKVIDLTAEDDDTSHPPSQPNGQSAKRPRTVEPSRAVEPTFHEVSFPHPETLVLLQP